MRLCDPGVNLVMFFFWNLCIVILDGSALNLMNYLRFEWSGIRQLSEFIWALAFGINRFKSFSIYRRNKQVGIN